MSSRDIPSGNVIWLKVEAARWWEGKWVFADCCWRPITINGLLTPQLGRSMREAFIIATSKCHQSAPVPLFHDHPSRSRHHRLLLLFSFLSVFHLRTNPSHTLSSFTSHTQSELWVHPPLIHHQSYFS